MFISSVIFTLRFANTANFLTKCKFGEQNLTNRITLANKKKLSYIVCYVSLLMFYSYWRLLVFSHLTRFVSLFF